MSHEFSLDVRLEAALGRRTGLRVFGALRPVSRPDPAATLLDRDHFSWLYVNMSARKKADMMFVRFEDRLLVASDEGQAEIADNSKGLHDEERERKRARRDDEPPAEEA